MTDLTERLRECPFCGGEATVVVSDLRPCNVNGWADGYSVFCRESVRCSGRLPKFHKTRDEAIAAWNERPTLETLTQENARLEKDRGLAIKWANQSVSMLQSTFFPVADALRALEAYLANTPHHNAPEAAAARKVLRAFDACEVPSAPARKALGDGDE